MNISGSQRPDAQEKQALQKAEEIRKFKGHKALQGGQSQFTESSPIGN